MTFADEDKSDIPIRAVSQPDTTQTPQYQKKSLDTIMIEQELAQLRAEVSQLQTQQDMREKPPRQQP